MLSTFAAASSSLFLDNLVLLLVPLYIFPVLEYVAGSPVLLRDFVLVCLYSYQGIKTKAKTNKKNKKGKVPAFLSCCPPFRFEFNIILIHIEDFIHLINI